MSSRRITEGDGDPRHGTHNGYVNLRCRCQPCRDAMAAAMRAQRARMRSKPVPDHVHGSDNGYCNYGCRCVPCTAAHTESDYRRRYGLQWVRTDGAA